jgi:hypothetical protein
MKKSVKITIDREKPKGEITTYASPFDVNDTMTVLELKTQIRNSITTPYEVVSQTLWNGTDELKNDSELLPKNPRFEYVLLVK